MGSYTIAAMWQKLCTSSLGQCATPPCKMQSPTKNNSDGSHRNWHHHPFLVRRVLIALKRPGGTLVSLSNSELPTHTPISKLINLLWLFVAAYIVPRLYFRPTIWLAVSYSWATSNLLLLHGRQLPLTNKGVAVVVSFRFYRCSLPYI